MISRACREVAIHAPFPQASQPCLPDHASTKLSYYIEGGNPPNLTGQIKKPARMSPIYKESEKTENVSGEAHFYLIS